MNTQRILALDVLRGMTIFLMIVVNNPGSWSHVYAPLLHAEWHGCTPTDLVFPFFMFVVGLSMYISKSRFKESEDVWLRKSLIRGAKIVGIGLLINWFPFYDKNIESLRLFGVLQRIGLAYLLAAIVIRYIKSPYLWYAIVVILLSYWGIMTVGRADGWSLEGNLVKEIDLALFGEKHIYKGFGIPFDPEGLLSTWPAIATILLGYMASRWYETDKPKMDYIKLLLGMGAVSAVLGYVWDIVGVPINKPLWTSSYVLWTAGLCMLLYAALIYVIDELKIKGWTAPFRIFGQNPLACFVLSGLIVKILSRIKIDKSGLYGYAYNNGFSHLGEKFGSLLQALCFVGIIWLIALFLDKKGWIIKA